MAIARALHQIDTTNDFMVGSQGDLIVLLRPPGRAITKVAALRLAAYLVAMADESPNHLRFGLVLDGVESAG